MANPHKWTRGDQFLREFAATQHGGAQLFALIALSRIAQCPMPVQVYDPGANCAARMQAALWKSGS
jgi:hypothetical protein